MNDFVFLAANAKNASTSGMFVSALSPPIAGVRDNTVHGLSDIKPVAADVNLTLLSLLPVGILVIDERRNALFSNRVAEQIIASGNPLLLDNDRNVRVRDKAGQSAFVIFVDSMFSRSVNEVRYDVHIIMRDKGLLPVAVSATRCDHHFVEGAGERWQARALMCLRDPQQSPIHDGNTLRRMFGFTTAESGLAIALLTGYTLSEYATQRGVRPNTVRTQLKAILGKTGLHRQTDLIRLLTTI